MEQRGDDGDDFEPRARRLHGRRDGCKRLLKFNGGDGQCLRLFDSRDGFFNKRNVQWRE